MKGLFYLTIVTLLLTANTFAQYNDPVKNYSGIPLITYMGIPPIWAHVIPANQFKQMEDAGIFALEWVDLQPDPFNYYIVQQTDSLLVFPEQTAYWYTNLQNYIYKYCQGIYTVFEAEGTPEAQGSVTLYHDSLPNLKVENCFVSTTDSTPNGTMIYGPMYRQCRNYTAVEPGIIDYRASYRLKLENIIPHQHSANDTICILLVTSTKTWEDSIILCNGKTINLQPFKGFGDTLIHQKKVITYGLFDTLGVWKTFDLDYFFPRDESTWYRGDSQNLFGNRGLPLQTDMSKKISQNCVEFKVVWKGDPQKVKLSVDKVIVSDNRGRSLKEESYPEILIREQLSQGQSLYGNRLAGWIGMDEPWSLDTWEPIRIVQNILEDHNASLWFQFNVQHNGRFRPWEDPALGSKVNMIDEFMRRVGKANVFITQTKDSFLIFLGNKPKTPLISQF